MTLPGFELLFSSVQSQIKSLEDAAVIAIHWNIISHGFKCTGVGEKPQKNVKTESLPNGWNSNEIYELHYQDSKSGKRCVLKIVPVDGLLLVHFQRTDAENVASIDVRVDNFVTHDHTNITNAYTSLEQLNSEVSNSLINPVMGITSSSNTKASSTHASSSRDYKRMEEESPLFVGERKAPPRQPQSVHPSWADPLGMDPFSVGRADLDPLGGMGGGGMFMDPRHIGPRFGPERGGPYGPQRGGGIHPGMLPPGAVPPGARFDPIGPGGMRGGPDPDHERPPEYDDMFM